MQKWMLSVVVLVLIAPQASVAEQLTLTTGETLKVRIIDRSEQSVTLQHPILGQLTIERSHIVTLAETASDRQPAPDTPRADSVNQPAQQDPAAGMAPGSTLAPLLHSRDWQFEIGLSGSDGNSQTTNLRLGLISKKEDDLMRSMLKSSYYFSKSEGNTTRNEFNAQLTHDWLIPDSPWFFFTQGIYDYDQFQSWDQRLSGFAGFGYELIKTDRFELVGRTGGGLTKEFGGEKELRPEGLISAAILKWNLTANQTLAGSATFYPDLAELGQFRSITKFEWNILLSHTNGLSLKLGLENEYESHVESDSDHNDLKYYGTLTIDF